MSVASGEVAISSDPLTSDVREQLERIYEETSYIIAGTLGRTAAIGGEPDYWYRKHGVIRDIDVHDPYNLTSSVTHDLVDGEPLPVDKASKSWLFYDGNGVKLSFPRDRSIEVELPESTIETKEVSLLGVPVRIFSPQVLMGLNTAVPYNRLNQRAKINRFAEWVQSQPDFDPSTQLPFQEFANRIRREHPEYVGRLMLKDLVGQLPTPLHNLSYEGYRLIRYGKKGS